MTTFTLTVDDRAAEHIRRIAAQEHKDPAAVAAQMLEWAAEQQVVAPPGGTSDKVTLATRQTQIRQIFERNEW